MTCVVTNHWQPFSVSHEWSPMMNTESPNMSPSYGLDGKPQQGYISSESESRHTASGSGKKRASRAGTRSVTTLSAAQLERKRANDREAQRAIRQRTKDHIDSLERNISDLQTAQNSNEKVLVATQQRNRELEEENVYLKSKLGGDIGYHVNLAPNDSQRASESGMQMPHTASPGTQTSVAHIARPGSTSAPRSHSLTASQTSTSRHGSWQQPQPAFPAAASQNLTTPANTLSMGPNLTTWRSHDSTQSMHSTPTPLQDHSQPQSSASYPTDRPQQWPAAHYTYQDAKPQQPAPQPAYAASYPATAPPPQQQPYVAQQPLQTDFQNMAVSSPAYAAVQHAPQPQSQQPQPHPPQHPPQHYQPYAAAPMPHMQNTADYASAPPPQPQPQGYAMAPPPRQQQQQQQQVQFRDGAGQRSFGVAGAGGVGVGAGGYGGG